MSRVSASARRLSRLAVPVTLTPVVAHARGVAVVAALVLGCGGGSTTRSTSRPEPPAPGSAELSPALAPLAWWLGDWVGEHGSEHWVAAAGAMYGIALDKSVYEVMIIDDADGPGTGDGIRRFIAMPGGTRSVEFREVKMEAQSASFTNPTHDFPVDIAYRRDGDALIATLSGHGQPEQVFRFRRGPAAARSPELEAADIAFSDATGARGVAGWVAAFAPDGAMLRKSGRIVGADAIGAAMKPLLSEGKLAWAPIASHREGPIGFTVGKATYTAAKPEDSWRSTYVTIWKVQPDGGWKVAFDTGRVINE